MSGNEDFSHEDILEEISLPDYCQQRHQESILSDVRELSKTVHDVDNIINTIEEKYLSSSDCDIFQINELDTSTGHIFLQAGYSTINQITSASIPKLRNIQGISESRAKTIFIAAKKQSRIRRKYPTGDDCLYIGLGIDDGMSVIENQLSDLSDNLSHLIIVVDGTNIDRSISERAIRDIAADKADVVTIRDRRRHRLEANLQEIDCTAANYTHEVLSDTGSIPSWLTANHYYREVGPPEELDIPPKERTNMFVLGLHRYRPVTKNTDKRSIELHRFAKKDGDKKPMGKAMLDFICRRVLRDAETFDYAIPFPSSDGGYSDALEFTVSIINKSTPIGCVHLVEGDGKESPQKAMDTKLDRWRNARDSTRVATDFDGGSFLLIDDICSSGASLYWARQQLLEAGADTVLPIVYGLNTGWGTIHETKGPGATFSDLRIVEEHT